MKRENSEKEASFGMQEQVLHVCYYVFVLLKDSFQAVVEAWAFCISSI